MTDNFSDSQLDQQIRNVRVPDGLLASLRLGHSQNVLAWTDEQLDEVIDDVAVPDALLNQLRAIPDDVCLDKQIRDVEVAWSLQVQLSRQLPVRRRPTLSGLAVAAMIFIAASVVYHFSVAALFFGMRAEPVEYTYLDVEYDGPLDIQAAPEAVIQLTSQLHDSSTLDGSPPKFHVDIESPLPPKLASSGPAGQLIEEIQNGLPLEADIFLVSYGPLGFPQRSDEKLPRFEEPPPPPQGGVEPPLVRPFNRRFLLKYGVNPPVFPEFHRSLRTSLAPLSTSTRTFDLSTRRLAASRFPARDEVLVEDFLAASTAGQERGRERLNLDLCGAPSVFGTDRGRTVVKDLGWQPGPAQLLQISVSTGWQPRGGRPVQLTIALDVSSSMRWDGRLATAKSAIHHVVRQFGPRDRLSVLGFNERAERWIEGVDRESQSDLSAFFASLRADGGTNLPRALQTAMSAALESAADLDADAVLVLITDGRAPMAQQTLQQLREMFAIASAQGLRFFLIEMNETYDSDPDLDELRRALQGDKRTAMDSQAVNRAILEGYWGQDTLIAMDAKLTVRFDPEVVLAYRLMGHNAASGAGLIPFAAEANLHAGETATCLYEVWLRPGKRGMLAEAELQWHDVQSGRMLRRRQAIATRQLNASFLSAPPSLQAAAIAAETAEVLSGSPLSGSRNRSLAHVLDLTQRMSSRAFNYEGLGKLVQFVQLAERIRKERLAPPVRE